jgi:hypothetical protein
MDQPSVNWADLVTKYGLEDVKPTEKKKPIANVVTWKNHRCDSKHKTAATFLKCSLRRYTPNVSGKLTLPSIRVSGSGLWAVIETGSSDSYYTYHNNKELNHQHVIYDITLFKTLEEAAEHRDMLSKRFNSPNGAWNSSGPMRDIVKVML